MVNKDRSSNRPLGLLPGRIGTSFPHLRTWFCGVRHHRTYSWFGFIVMAVGSSSNWYALIDIWKHISQRRSASSPSLSCVTLPPSLSLSLSFAFVLFFSSRLSLSSTDSFFPSSFSSLCPPPSFLSFFSHELGPAGDRRLPICAVNYAYPLLRSLTCLWLERAGAAGLNGGKKVAGRARGYGEPLTTAVQLPNIMTTTGQNLLSKRPWTRWREPRAGYIESLSVCWFNVDGLQPPPRRRITGRVTARDLAVCIVFRNDSWSSGRERVTSHPWTLTRVNGSQLSRAYNNLCETERKFKMPVVRTTASSYVIGATMAQKRRDSWYAQRLGSLVGPLRYLFHCCLYVTLM